MVIWQAVFIVKRQKTEKRKRQRRKSLYPASIVRTLFGSSEGNHPRLCQFDLAPMRDEKRV